mgnify:CR=1 FL=1
MSSDFSRSLSLLRQEKGISQRAVAKDLGISQALLSHYENGAREPGLAFVCKACDYYGVSADYLLCRSELPNAPQSTAEAARAFLGEMNSLMNKARQALDEFTGKGAQE